MLIRPGKKEDLPQVLGLIKELAVYEKAADEVDNTVTRMEVDGFGENPVYGFFVAAEREGPLVGIAIYYYRYSTWKGKWLYLEDLIVTESQRGQGIGKQLLDRTIQKALDENCTGMMWQVLDWNTPAIHFYEKHYRPVLDSEWINCKLTHEQMRKAIAENKE